ncbi:MAG: rRNA maturation RNase YbeY [Candidatus Andersenbacteria bacterium]|nr:rRNA maturation RNase YbeY [Candidatus Andersenbacteria bacterium]MBI3251022.1 rRNA maturation RNase YbeY [Candidatus Andersenbacteria bacterium]
MPTVLQSEEEFVLTPSEVERLWQEVRKACEYPDDEVAVRCVSEEEIKKLNTKYRKKNHATNILTFTYDEQHDIALCLSVAEEESREQEVALRDYVALLLVHAFLHATGMDHERSEEEAENTEDLETTILSKSGFSAISLSA